MFPCSSVIRIEDKKDGPCGRLFLFLLPNSAPARNRSYCSANAHNPLRKILEGFAAGQPPLVDPAISGQFYSVGCGAGYE